jgi:RNA polymerase sigma factor (sigma-70 family)
MSDSHVIEKAWRAFAHQQDPATFEAFYTASRDLAARIAWRALGDSEWMEDAMQALFARLWQDRASRVIPSGLSAREALIRWTLNECRTLNRRRARAAQREAPLEAASQHPSPNPLPDEVADHRLLAEAVRRLLATLPDPYREALVACEIEGTTHAEAGTILGLPARTIQTHVRRGKELLARKLRNAGITLPAGAALAIYATETSAAISWPTASVLIANASTTVATAGAIVPSEGAAAASVFTLPVMATAAACLVGIAALVWVMAAPPTNPPAVAASGAINPAVGVAMAVPADSGNDDSLKNTDVTQGDTDERSGAASGAAADGIEMAAFDSAPESAQDDTVDVAALGETFSAMGRILSASTREGIAGATIGIMSYNMSEDMEELPRFASAEIQTRLDVTTEADGSFNLHIPESDKTEMGIFLFARAEGHANQTIWFWPNIWEPLGKPTMEIPLPDEGTLSGRVQGPNGEPLAGFLVGFPLLSPFDFAPLLETGYLGIPAAVTLTDSDGAFHLTGLPAGRTFDLPIVHNDWPAHFEKGVLIGARGLTIAIPSRGETVRGMVSEGDTLLAGWQVQFSQPEMGGISDFTRAMASPKMTTTDRDGRYEIRGILPGEYSASASSMKLSRSESQKVTIVAGHSTAIDLHVAPPVMVELQFRAVDVDTGEPVPGVQLATSDFHIEIPGRRPGLRTPPDAIITDSEGRTTLKVTVDWMSRGYVPEVLLPTGYVTASGTYRGFTERFGFTGHRFDPTEIHTIQLKRGRVLEGVVLDVDGTPAAGAWVRTTSDLVGADCDERGRFKLTMPELASELLIVRSARGGLVMPVPSNTETSTVEVPLAAYGMLSGTLKDSTGRGVPNVGINFDMLRIGDGPQSMTLAMGFTRRDGQFLVREIIPGKYALDISAELQTKEVVPHDLTVEIAPGQVLRDFDIMTTRGRTFEGVVTNTDADPLGGVDVSLHVRLTTPDGRYASPYLHSVKTEEDGYWKQENVPEGRVESASFSRDGYNQHHIMAEEGKSLESPLNAMLKLMNNVSFRVLDATTGTPIPHYSYTSLVPHRWSPEGGFGNIPRTVVNNPQGVSPAKHQSEGQLAVVVFELDGAGNRTGRTTFRILDIGSGGEEQVIDILLGDSYPVTGKVAHHFGGAPIEGARITVGAFHAINHALPIPKHHDLEEVISGPDGTFTINLGPGIWELIASKGEEFSKTTQTVHVADGPVQIESAFGLTALSPSAR